MKLAACRAGPVIHVSRYASGTVDASLPKKMTGGVRNPLGAIALYLGD
jgi:hypothetical protein